MLFSMTMIRAHLLCPLLISLVASACAAAGDDSVTPAGPDAGPAAAPDSGQVDAADPSPVEPADGPAAHLLIDGTVHTGTDWSGAPYVGVWGEPFDFDMTAYPITWAIATVHASLLLRARGIDYSPNAVLSIAIKESRLGCEQATFPGPDGCFQIENGSAYVELDRIFPGRFTADHSAVVGGAHFESAALASAYYALFSMAMFRLHSPDPAAFFANHPDPLAQQKVLCAAYNRGLWWMGLAETFANCGQRDVTECFEDNAIAIDHANAIADYSRGLDGAPPLDVDLDLADLVAYWNSIAALYPDVDSELAIATLTAAFDQARGADPSISFHLHLVPVLRALIAQLPAAATVADAAAAACALGYLYGDKCE